METFNTILLYSIPLNFIEVEVRDLGKNNKRKVWHIVVCVYLSVNLRNPLDIYKIIRLVSLIGSFTRDIRIDMSFPKCKKVYHAYIHAFLVKCACVDYHYMGS